MATVIAWLVGLTLVLGSFGAGVVCLLKGKWFVGILALPLAATGIPVAAACRLARPDSWWATRRYEPRRAAQALARWPLRSPRRIKIEILVAVVMLGLIALESTVVP